MNTFLQWIDQVFGLDPVLRDKLLSTLLILVGFWLLRWILLRSLVDRMQDQKLQFRWRKISSYLFFLFVLLFVGPVWLEGARSFATYLGLLSAGLAVALQDPITDLIGWAFILWRKSFEVGDRIEIDGHAGDVIDLRIFQFTLMEIGKWVEAEQTTGRILHIPNGKIFTSVLANYSKGSDYIWNELPVLITFESNWEKAKRLLSAIAQKHTEQMVKTAEESFRQAARQYMIQYGSLNSRVYTSVQDSGVLLTIRYLVEPGRRRDSTEEMWEEILRTFDQYKDIDFAYPTQRFYNLEREGV